MRPTPYGRFTPKALCRTRVFATSIEAERDFPAARDLALAAALSGDIRYSAAAIRILAAWLKVYRPNFNVYDLEPLTVAALAARMHGEDWYALQGRSGATLRKALDWLVPFADGSKVHQEFVHSAVRFDDQRRDAGVAGFSGNFDPKAARNVFATAARLDRKYATIATQLQSVPWLDVIWPLS